MRDAQAALFFSAFTPRDVLADAQREVGTRFTRARRRPVLALWNSVSTTARSIWWFWPPRAKAHR